MRVAAYYSNKDIRIDEIPIPRINRKEILMSIEASGICGSDVMEWYRIDKVPLILGHEVAGRVIKVGHDVKRFKINDRIIATHHVPCLKCAYCDSGHSTVCDTLRKTHFYPGGFSEYVRLPEINVQFGTFKLPRTVSFEEGTFVEPLGCVLRGQKLAKMEKGKSVLVLGSGIAGLLHIKLAKYFQAKIIIATDIDRYRLKMAKCYGATASVYAENNIPDILKKKNNGQLADLVILCTAAPQAIYHGFKSVKRGGTVLIFTAAQKEARLPLPINEIFWRSEITVTSSYAASPQDLKEALALIKNKNVVVKDMITHRVPLHEIQKGFFLVSHPKKSMKVIVEPQR